MIWKYMTKPSATAMFFFAKGPIDYFNLYIVDTYLIENRFVNRWKMTIAVVTLV